MAANTQQRLSRRRLLALPAASVAVAALPAAAAAAAAGAGPSPLADLIDRHKAAAAALDAACVGIDRIERDIAAKYPAEVCRSWLRDGAPARTKWLRVRKAHGLDTLEHERQTLDKTEKELALALLACPCGSIDEVRLKAHYLMEADIVRENLAREEAFVEALLRSLAG